MRPFVSCASAIPCSADPTVVPTARLASEIGRLLAYRDTVRQRDTRGTVRTRPYRHSADLGGGVRMIERSAECLSPQRVPVDLLRFIPDDSSALRAFAEEPLTGRSFLSEHASTWGQASLAA